MVEESTGKGVNFVLESSSLDSHLHASLFWFFFFSLPFFFVSPSLAARIFTFRFLLLSSFGARLLWLLLWAVFVLAGVVVEEFGRSVLGFSGD